MDPKAYQSYKSPKIMTLVVTKIRMLSNTLAIKWFVSNTLAIHELNSILQKI